MAQFLTLLSILLLVAVFNPDKYESSALAVPGSEEDGEGKSDSNECLERDEKTSFCIKLRNYPDHNHINQLINEKYPHYKSFFNKDLVLKNITHRMEGPRKEYLCDTYTANIFPEGAKDEDEWDFVINTDEYKQGIVVEMCSEFDGTCGEGKGIFVPNSYKAICKQQYFYQAFLIYANRSIDIGQFKYPSCCICELLTDF